MFSPKFTMSQYGLTATKKVKFFCSQQNFNSDQPVVLMPTILITECCDHFKSK